MKELRTQENSAPLVQYSAKDTNHYPTKDNNSYLESKLQSANPSTDVITKCIKAMTKLNENNGILLDEFFFNRFFHNKI